MEEIAKEKTPKGRLDQDTKSHTKPEETLKKWPDGVNPSTGEVSQDGDFQSFIIFQRGGPAGPEPTRYGDWERKGRVSDF